MSDHIRLQATWAFTLTVCGVLLVAACLPELDTPSP